MYFCDVSGLLSFLFCGSYIELLCSLLCYQLMRYEFPFHVFHKTDSMPAGVVNVEGYASIGQVMSKVRQLLETAGIRDVVVVSVTDATYQEMLGVVWPFQHMLRTRYGERLTCAEVLPPACMAEAGHE